ncbi:MAG: DUF4179 domain-containing protein [Tissierellia bacterium]|nr:DUF4179 domain-containing protein [Tissierellia bacterium]
MKNKNVYELLNDMELQEHEVDVEFSEHEVKKIMDYVSPKISRKKRTFWIPKVAVAAVLIISFMISSPGQRIYASVKKTYDGIVSSMVEGSPNPDKMKEVIITPDLQVEDQGVIISLEEVLLDENTLHVTAIMELQDPKKYREFRQGRIISISPVLDDIRMDGESIFKGVSGRAWSVSNYISQLSFDIVLNDSINNNSDIELLFNRIDLSQHPNFNIPPRTIEGNWKFTLKGKDIIKDLHTKVYAIDRQIGIIDDKPIFADYIRYNDFRVQLFLKRDRNDYSRTFPSNVLIEDNQQRKYYFSTIADDMTTTTLVYYGDGIEELLKQKEWKIQMYEQEKVPEEKISGDPVKIIFDK